MAAGVEPRRPEVISLPPPPSEGCWATCQSLLVNPEKPGSPGLTGPAVRGIELLPLPGGLGHQDSTPESTCFSARISVSEGLV